eukprot:TRINITY_DN113696_c0_g1_i1.p1 TRINITY_DN113696_c0_g1~~TRINITY_DN113696_c0_g1_i1.p1  ORF type:complete len:889 (-),score=184.55 TRINITY_DN113696_c0_g1_i1:103-2523(-)
MVPNLEFNTSTKSTVEDLVALARTNVGAMRNNHVRLTIQTACFQRNEEKRFQGGYPWIIDPVLRSATTGCADVNCMSQMINSSRPCHNSDGVVQDKQVIIGQASGVAYRYTEADSFAGIGGIAIGLGSTRKEAEQIWKLVDKKDSIKPVSLVFEFVNYNPSFDLFTYTTVKFSRLPTGLLKQDVYQGVFPLTLFSAGSIGTRAEVEQFHWVMFLAYLGATVLFIAFLVKDMILQIRITHEFHKPVYMFPVDFIMDDVWNAVDLISVILNVMVIDTILRFRLINGAASLKTGITSWTADFKFEAAVGENDLDPFSEFHQAASIYRQFVDLLAVNGFFLMVRFVKYFRALTAFRLVLTTLAHAIQELFTMIVIIFVIFAAFVFMFFSRFGITFSRYGSLAKSGRELFLFMNGSFDVEDLYLSFPTFFTIVFLLYEITFFMVLNIFLAATVYRWRDTRRDAEEFSLQSFLHTLKDALKLNRLLKHAKGMDQEKQLEKLETEFWQKQSVLRHITHLDESGRILIPQEKKHRTEDSADEKEAAEDEEGSEAGSDRGDAGPFKFDSSLVNSEKKRFHKVFKKAHMEIASQKCRNLEVKDRAHLQDDTGGGVGRLEANEGGEQKEEDEPLEEEADLKANEEQDMQKLKNDMKEEETMIGIIEDPQPENTVSKIEGKLKEQRAEASVVQEIWLDALVSVLEEADALEKLRKLFLPMPMIYPKKPQEWEVFKEKRKRMERRLNLFLKWLQEEAEIQHCKYLKDMAVSKERVLKQQSLVLADYLGTLDDEIDKLQEEIKVLERKNAAMRSHVSPLL